MEIDTSIQFNTEVPKGKDADTWSPTLQAYHRYLWSKALPSGEDFQLTIAGRPGRFHLVHQSGRGELQLSSDAITNRLRNSPVARSLGDEERPPSLGYTIGSALVFPRRRRDGKHSINQGRGMHPKIRDRFDLTLECIRRHYEGQQNPLEDLIRRYDDFFELFVDFRGYVDFFLLQDLVDANYQVSYFHDFDNFNSPAVPRTKEAYLSYVANSNAFIRARNKRIAEWARQN